MVKRLFTFPIQKMAGDLEQASPPPRRVTRSAVVLACGMFLAAAVGFACNTQEKRPSPVVLSGWGNLLDIMSGKAKLPGEKAAVKPKAEGGSPKSSALRRLGAKVPASFQAALNVWTPSKVSMRT